MSEVSEVSVSTTPSPFPTSSVINFSELAKEQLSRPDILRLKVSPTLRLATVPVQDGSLLLPTQFQAQVPQPICSMKTLKIRCLVFNLFRLVIIFLHGHVAPLAPLYEAPHKVLSHSTKTFQLQVGKRVEVVSVQRIKPAFTQIMKLQKHLHAEVDHPRQPPLVPPDPPRQRGRPRKVMSESSDVAPPKRKKVP